MKTCLLLLLSLSLPLVAQNTDPAANDLTQTQNPSVLPAPPRDMVPRSINHKPNPTNPPPEIAGPIDKLFKGLETGNYSDAFDTFLSGTRLGAQKEKESRMISHTEEAFGIYGRMFDYEIYDNYSVGSNVLVLTYLSRHQQQPLRWRFIYYRAQKTWALINMSEDDFLLDMLD
jgi:hypothetical protein